VVATDSWTIYWQADHPDSCIATGAVHDADTISDFWQSFAQSTAAESRVLDLATGNGTVPLALLQGNTSLLVTGVDRADIDPKKYLASSDLLDPVEFTGGIDVCELPFAAGAFDVLSSQFGIEYAPLEKAVPAIATVLRSGGRLQFVLHHAASDIVVATRKKRKEMEGLLSE